MKVAEEICYSENAEGRWQGVGLILDPSVDWKDKWGASRQGAQRGILEVNVCGCGWEGQNTPGETDAGPDLQMREIFLFIN